MSVWIHEGALQGNQEECGAGVLVDWPDQSVPGKEKTDDLTGEIRPLCLPKGAIKGQTASKHGGRVKNRPAKSANIAGLLMTGLNIS
jgi:hypothetical protein